MSLIVLLKPFAEGVILNKYSRETMVEIMLNDNKFTRDIFNGIGYNKGVINSDIHYKDILF